MKKNLFYLLTLLFIGNTLISCSEDPPELAVYNEYRKIVIDKRDNFMLKSGNGGYTIDVYDKEIVSGTISERGEINLVPLKKGLTKIKITDQAGKQLEISVEVCDPYLYLTKETIELDVLASTKYERAIRDSLTKVAALEKGKIIEMFANEARELKIYNSVSEMDAGNVAARGTYEFVSEGNIWVLKYDGVTQINNVGDVLANCLSYFCLSGKERNNGAQMSYALPPPLVYESFENLTDNCKAKYSNAAIGHVLVYTKYKLNTDHNY